jgi:hypothetical protein
MTTKKKDVEINSADDIKLKWRLTSAPTLDDVKVMLESGIIDKSEAKQILFSEVNRDGQVKALEEQVDFLKDIIDRLSKQPPQQVWTYVNSYQPARQWQNIGIGYSSPVVLCKSVGSLASNSTTGTSGTTISYGSKLNSGTIIN